MLELSLSEAEPVVRLMPVLLDRLVQLMVLPPVLQGLQCNLAQTAFEAIAAVVGKITVRIIAQPTQPNFHSAEELIGLRQFDRLEEYRNRLHFRCRNTAAHSIKSFT